MKLKLCLILLFAVLGLSEGHQVLEGEGEEQELEPDPEPEHSEEAAAPEPKKQS